MAGAFDKELGLSGPPASGGATEDILGISSGKKSGKGGRAVKQSWVTALQNKLVEKSKELNIQIDLGPTGVDGVYGRKTRGAVEVIAKALKIENPLDANGRPTQEFNTKIGLGEAGTAPPSPVAPGATEASPGQSPQPAEVMTSVSVEGKDFDLGAFGGSLPPDMAAKNEGGRQAALSPAEAFRRFRMIMNAVVAGGLPVSTELPKMWGLPNASDYQKAHDDLRKLWLELDSNLKKLGVAINAEIVRKRKEMGLPEKISSGATQEAYKSELAYSQISFAATQGLGYAYKWLEDYLEQMAGGDKTNPQSLLELIQKNTGIAVNADFPHAKWTRDQAAAIGKVLMAAGGWLGARIVPTDTSLYYKGPYNDLTVNQAWQDGFLENKNRIWQIIRGQK